jgi:hypothetical protein
VLEEKDAERGGLLIILAFWKTLVRIDFPDFLD